MNFLLLILRTIGRIPCIASYCHTGRIGMMQRSIQARVQVSILTITPLSPTFFSFFCLLARRSALFHVARARVCHQARELILTNFLTVFSLVYPEEGSIAETSVKILIITAFVLQFLN